MAFIMTALCLHPYPAGLILWNIECHIPVQLTRALKDHTLACGKYPCLHSRMYVEAHVPWLMAVSMKKTKHQSRRYLPRTFWIVIPKTRHHSLCFSIPLGSSTDLIVLKPFSNLLTPFWPCPMFILLPAKN